ncbi:gas vesicle protein [Streptomyces sp. ZSW22]|uniref:gas vesicle protein n=1 Tax=Streptomyces sp. ZSW22 TaxID=3055050 RepID=UPI0025B0D4D1|nr:gas vesicle protein [Streptomyces sp. ZSW22]MDN3244234.1 gas vesicle protein [Streptomyces sp. ZSW22]
MTDVDHRYADRETQPCAPVTGNLADLLERVLDKGIVIAGDIKIDLLDIELLTIRLRLFIASVDTAKKAGIDWWETDPALSSRAARDALAEENARLRARLDALEEALEEAPVDGAEETTEAAR